MLGDADDEGMWGGVSTDRGRAQEQPWFLMTMLVLLVTVTGSFTAGWHITELNIICSDERNSIWTTLKESPDFNPDDKFTTIELFTATTLIGALIGSFLDVVPKTFGYKPTLLVPVVMSYTLGTLLSMTGTSDLIIAGRLFSGLGAGMSVIIAPVLLSEVATAGKRGRISAAHQVMYACGMLAGSLVGWVFVANVAGGWRWMLLCSLIPSAISCLAGWAFIVESPRWLVRQSEEDVQRAQNILNGLRPDGAVVQEELMAMKDEIVFDRRIARLVE